MLPKRYTAVPWIEPSDLQPAGQPMWDISDGDRVIQGFFVNHFEQRLEHTLVVKAQRGNGNDGGTITLSLASRLTFCEDDGA